MFRSFVYRYTRTQPKFKSSCDKLTRYQLTCPKQQKNNNNKSSNNIVFDFVEMHAKSERPFFCEILNKRRESLNAKGKKTKFIKDTQTSEYLDALFDACD